MKTKLNNHNNNLKVVCEDCEQPFIVGEKFIINGGPFPVLRSDYFMGIEYPYTDHTIDINDNSWHHDTCINKKSTIRDLDPLKEAINTLPSKDKLELYKYLYHTHRCRI